MARKVLGRGLGALIGSGFASTLPPRPSEAAIPPAQPTTQPSVNPVAGNETIIQVPLEKIQPSRFQPRVQFESNSLAELVESIRHRGVIQPLIVRRAGDKFELIAGERRWRATKEVGLTVVPVIVREASDREALELALIENLQRENLNPIEEARGYRQLIGQFGLRQEDIAQRVGKNRTTIANSLRLLTLPDEVQKWVEQGELSVGHAKVILALETSALQRRAASRALKKGLTVRNTERLIERWKTGGFSRRRRTELPHSAQVSALEEHLQQKFGTRCRIVGESKGRIEIEFYSPQELDRLLILLGASEP